jgi:hypothetical protein
LNNCKLIFCLNQYLNHVSVSMKLLNGIQFSKALQDAPEVLGNSLRQQDLERTDTDVDYS